MKRFVRTKDFQDLNVGAALDEGMASPTDGICTILRRRCVWRKFYALFQNRNKEYFLDLKIHCSGRPGHGSLLLDNTAGEKATHILNKLFAFRIKRSKISRQS
jgi:aminoacylase